MATPPRSPAGDELLFDSAHPFRGVVVCCTSIPTELRADIAAKTTELGGVHKYDLTPDCTHLIVGDYDTPKYRHVAKERPDVRVMAAAWVETVRDLWVQDAPIDFLALERECHLRPFESGAGDPQADRQRLLCCMTGFEDPDERQDIIDKIEANGGIYTGDLTRRVTHLIVNKPEGRKYNAALNWEIRTVAMEWVNDSVERGLILDEKLYDPMMPPERRGLGAWNKNRSRVSSLGKRLRETAAAPDEGRRKLRKTASMKLNSQRDNLWGDILGKPQASEPASTAAPVPTKPATTHQTQPTQPSANKSLDTHGSNLSSFGRPDDSAVFASCCFFVHGFSPQKTGILVNTIASMGGLICHSLDEVVSTSGAQMFHRFLIVPQYSLPDTHPRLPENVQIITEYYIERCLHKKYFFNPSEHVIGRPFPLFPIPGFEGLAISTAGFTGVDLNQVNKSIIQLGAKYEERFTANVSLLVCPSLAVVRKQKLELAVCWKVPVVSADWLWECISTGYHVPIRAFVFPELKQNLHIPKVLAPAKDKGKGKDASGKPLPTPQPGIDTDLLPKPATKSKQRHDLDQSAFVTAREEPTVPPRRRSPQGNDHDSNVTTHTHFETARTHLRTDSATTSFSAGTVSFGNISFGNHTLPEVADSDATEGDLGHPSDLPLLQEDENTSEVVIDLETEKKRLQAEAAAAERLAISTKLVTSLLTTATATCGSTTTIAAPARAVSAPELTRLDAAAAAAAAGVSAAASVSAVAGQGRRWG
ncbi:protein kinase activating protein dpb11 [Collariella sp. IMI 366227]|nr:protein kinase activating protein dpb11 [Collariella sp. IMI 366227]